MAEFAYKNLIAAIPDYPKPGVIFRDITPLLDCEEAFRAAVVAMAEPFRQAGITKVMGTESRGFMFGTPIAFALHAGFVPARKPGKLPRQVISQEYDLEYGTDRLEIHTDALTPDDVVLIVDDLIATGGTAKASGLLVQQCGARLAGMTFLNELPALGGRPVLEAAFPDALIHAVMEF
ncbi:MAG: adenine phosphoribosyltransferase [Coriobacteriia bacterium]|nr:adenine phosphoribosyltransferase [Coriobacteriia bacterium]